jgi:tight adherence protein B
MTRVIAATAAGVFAAAAAAVCFASSHRWRTRQARARLAAVAGASGAGPTALAAASRQPWPAVAAGAAVAVAGAATLGPAGLVLLGVGLVGAALVVPRRRRVQARARRRAQLPVALDRLAGALRSGSSLPVAIGEAGRATPDPVGTELVALAHDATRGRPVVDVLDGWVAQHGDPSTRLAAAAMVLATAVGATPARAVDGVATTLREREDVAAERRALAAQSRASVIVLSAAPLVLAVLLGVSDSAAARFLVGSPAGWACLVAGVALDGAGAWWMATLTRGSDA